MMDKCELIAQMAARDNLKYTNSISHAVNYREGFYEKYIKRIIDLLLSIPAFILLLPVNLLLGIITYFDVGSPIFFKQLRTGKNGKRFNLVKFRNMTNEKDVNGNLLPPNERVTKFGRFVRKGGYRFSGEQIYTMEGETVMGERYEEFYPDREALREQLIGLFYERVETGEYG